MSKKEEILALLYYKKPANQRELCKVLKIIFPKIRIITDDERDALDDALREFLESHKVKNDTSQPALQFLGFWKNDYGKDKEICALFIDPFFSFVPADYDFRTPVFGKKVVELNSCVGHDCQVSANWKEALRNWL